MSDLNQVLRHVPVNANKGSQVNVKLPEEYVKMIDESLKIGGVLRGKGFEGRAEVVRNAVFNFLAANGLKPSMDPKQIGKRSR